MSASHRSSDDSSSDSDTAQVSTPVAFTFRDEGPHGPPHEAYALRTTHLTAVQADVHNILRILAFSHTFTAPRHTFRNYARALKVAWKAVVHVFGGPHAPPRMDEPDLREALGMVKMAKMMIHIVSGASQDSLTHGVR